MPGRVGEGLLGDAQQGGAHLVVEGFGGAGDGELGADAGPLRPGGDRLLQRAGQVVVFQRGRQQIVHRAARLAEAVPGERGGTGEVFPGERRVGPGRGGDGLELRDDTGESLGDGVVDLGRQPAPLVGHPRLACLHQELGVQSGVLRQGLFETGVGRLQGVDGVGLVTRLLRLPVADLREEHGEASVHGQHDEEDDPVHEGHGGNAAAGLRSRHDDGGGQQPGPHAPLREQPAGVEVAEHRVDREERVAPRQPEGQEGAGGEVVPCRPRPLGGRAAAPPELKGERGRDQHRGGVHLRAGHDEPARHGRDHGGQAEQTVGSVPEEPPPPLLGRRRTGHGFLLPGVLLPRVHGWSLP